jgi:tetratricopeptide (TPR) repeat protein
MTAQSGVGGGRTTGRRPKPAHVAEQQEQLLTKANAARKVNRDEAKKQYTEATRLMPTDARAFAGLGNVSIDDNKFEDAEKYYRKAIELNANYPDAQLPLAYSLARQGKYGEAIPIYEKLKQSDPKNPEVVNNLSAAYNATELFDKVAMKRHWQSNYSARQDKLTCKVTRTEMNCCRMRTRIVAMHTMV